VTKATKPKEKTVTKETPKQSTHRQWLYKGEDAKIFEEGETIPSGYVEAPAKVK